jgi:hypothetical protein
LGGTDAHPFDAKAQELFGSERRQHYHQINGVAAIC